MELDAARLMQAVSQKPTKPDWLMTGKTVYVTFLGWCQIKAIIGLTVVVSFEGGNRRLTNWEEAILDETLLEAPTQAVLEETPAFEAEIIPEGSTLARIKNNQFRQLARELDNAECLKKIDVSAIEPPEMVDLPADMVPALQSALIALGIKQIYSHQLQAYQALLAGKSVVLATPTASGKTLSYNPAILHTCLTSEATALYLFPLKALAKDQEEKLKDITMKMGDAVKIGTIDGDVEMSKRVALFKPTSRQPKGLQVLMQSPDSLHHQLYKIKKGDEWAPWKTFLRHLRFVVVDEAHTYRGSFGGHFAGLVNRLLNAIAEVGGQPELVQFVFATATVANPATMAGLFCNRPPSAFEVITRSGAGSKGRTTLCLKPSAQPNSDAAQVIELFFKYKVSGIVFCNSRNMAKALLNLVQSNLKHKGLFREANKIAVYYGGLRTDRRAEIINGLKEKTIQVIITTSALEAGIDLPELDAVLLNGYAGSLMSHRQRVGRAGRKREGLVIFLPSNSKSLDAYYGNNPDELLFGDVEAMAFNPAYPLVLAQHLVCAATEASIPLEAIDHRFGATASLLVGSLVSSRKLIMDNHRVSGKGYPHKEVNIRGASADSVRLIDEAGEEVESMDLGTAFKEVHPGALYNVQNSKGEIVRYRSKSLTLDTKLAHLEQLEEDPRRTTQASSVVLVKPVSMLKPPVAYPLKEGGSVRMRLTWGTITDLVTGYQEVERVEEKFCNRRGCQNHRLTLQENVCPSCRTYTSKRHARKVVDQVAFEKPYSTRIQAPILEVKFSPDVLDLLQGWVMSERQSATTLFQDEMPETFESLWDVDADYLAMHTLTHQLLFALPLVMLASSYDMNVLVLKQATSEVDEEQTDGTAAGEPALKKGELRAYFYDTADGGNGSTEALYDRFSDFVARAMSLSKACDCGDHGCPKCLIQSGCPQYNRALYKPLGLQLMASLAKGSENA
ncbi:MAG: DEAD/DEAH box helicase [Stenomitos frigidus ULC029]